jgi:hypothetical protein
LADELLIMSNRPGSIKETINIDLPRPRTPDLLTSTEYLRYKEESLEVLHSEAVKRRYRYLDGCLCFFTVWRLRIRTPKPPPFSSMKIGFVLLKWPSSLPTAPQAFDLAQGQHSPTHHECVQ